MPAGRLKLLCSSCLQPYRVVATDDPDDDVVFGQCDGCLIREGRPLNPIGTYDPYPPTKKEET